MEAEAMSPGIREALQRHGFAVIDEDAAGQESREAMARFGRLLTLPGLCEVQALELREKKDATPNTYSGNYGRGEFPLHTDLAHWSLPPRFLVLRCVVGAKDVPTRLVDGLDLIEAIGELKMSRAIVQPRRPLAGRLSLLRLLDIRARAKVLRWDDLFIVPVTAEGKCAFEAVRHHLAQTKSIEITLSKPGDTLIVDNWRMLHGRAAALRVTTRRLDRAYIDELEGA
jgi:alpha-ketoglutarate-dependent taurine dioxygenase